MAKTITIEDINKLKEEGLEETKDIAEALGVSSQKVGALIRKAEREAKEEQEAEEEISPMEFIKHKAGVVRNANMGGSIIMTAAEYNEYSMANGRYQGRREGEKTKLEPYEIRVNLNAVSRGDRSIQDVKKHLMDKHGINEDEFKQALYRLTKEEEISMGELLRTFGMR